MPNWYTMCLTCFIYFISVLYTEVFHSQVIWKLSDLSKYHIILAVKNSAKHLKRFVNMETHSVTLTDCTNFLLACIVSGIKRKHLSSLLIAIWMVAELHHHYQGLAYQLDSTQYLMFTRVLKMTWKFIWTLLALFGIRVWH